MSGIVMALYTRQSLSDSAFGLVSALYKVIAQIAETYVFVYLGMAFVAFPIFENLDYRLGMEFAAPPLAPLSAYRTWIRLPT